VVDDGGATPYYRHADVTLYHGDVCGMLATLPEASVQCVVTSPPYWGLRQYAGEQRETWGGDLEHAHVFGDAATLAQRIRDSAPGGLHEGRKTNTLPVHINIPSGAFCACGAWRGCLGLEPTPDCGAAGKVRLRRDLTPAQREFVIRRLLGVAAPDAANGGKAHKASRRSQRRNGGPDAPPTT